MSNFSNVLWSQLLDSRNDHIRDKQQITSLLCNDNITMTWKKWLITDFDDSIAISFVSHIVKYQLHLWKLFHKKITFAVACTRWSFGLNFDLFMLASLLLWNWNLSRHASRNCMSGCLFYDGLKSCRKPRGRRQRTNQTYKTCGKARRSFSEP